MADMPTLGQVTAASLNLRDGPDGNIVAVMPKGTSVEVKGSSGTWYQISATIKAQAVTGYASQKFITVSGTAPAPSAGTSTAGSAAPPTGVPVADDGTHTVTVSGGKAIGPDGKSFAKQYKLGFYTYGRTTLSSWLASTTPSTLSPSVVRVVRAVSLNEGMLEAVNSWDSAHMSFGIFQWTAGSGGDDGELAGLLVRLKQSAPSVFNDCFGRYGLDATLPGADAATGKLTLNGAALSSSTDKDKLRSSTWAYRFYRAGCFAEVRQAELELAAARIPRFLRQKVRGFTIGEWFTSEHGVALVLDQHVNRPGYVLGSIEAAIGALPAGMATNPATWTSAEEAKLIDEYSDAREHTKMTDPVLRATRISDCVHAGTLSDDRGSFSST
jgi:hypothetical protein